MGSAAGRLVTLGVNGQQFGVRADLVREVALLPRLARVPHAPVALLGLANIRGAVVPIMSLATLVERPGGVARRVVIVDDGEVIGLAVDEVSEMISDDEATASSLRALDIAQLVARSAPVTIDRRIGTGALSEQGKEEVGLVRQTLISFALGEQEFALPLDQVEEVMRSPDQIARLPMADRAVVGSTTLRGELLPLLSLSALLALPESDVDQARVVITRIGNHRVGLVVDGVRSILRITDDAIDPVPEVLKRGSAETRIQAICRLDDGKRLVSVLAVDELLRDDFTARLFEGAHGNEDMEQSSVERTFEQFLLFRIGDQEFGLPIASVEEVAVLPPKLTRLPKAPDFVRGVMNLRGQVVPVIDQAERFGVDVTDGAKRRVVVVRIGDLQAGFVVDLVADVLQVEQSQLRPAPDFGNAETRVFDRVANLDEQQRIVLIVSPQELLSRAEQDLLRAVTGKD